jgi:hypothetical protein
VRRRQRRPSGHHPASTKQLLSQPHQHHHRDIANIAMIYLQLFNGRENSQNQLDDCGSDGPIFGPLQYVHTTYGREIKFTYDNTSETEGSLTVTNDLLYYDRMYYADWAAFTDLPDTYKARIIEFDQDKASLITEPKPSPIDLNYLKELLLQLVENHGRDSDEIIISTSSYSEDDEERLNQIEDQAFREGLETEAGELVHRLITSSLETLTPANQAGNAQLAKALLAISAYHKAATPQSIHSMLGLYIRENIDNILSTVAPEATQDEMNAIKLSMLFEADKMDSENYQSA